MIKADQFSVEEVDVTQIIFFDLAFHFDLHEIIQSMNLGPSQLAQIPCQSGVGHV
jgi:hypothetical protein